MFFPQLFCITSIERIIYVSPEEYREKTTRFTHERIANELIFLLQGKSKVRFNGQLLRDQPGAIRFLPEGPVREYVVEREDTGACIDVVFHTDRPLADKAFVIDMAGNEEILSLFRKIFSVWNSRDDDSYFQAMSLLYRIFGLLAKNQYTHQHKLALIEPAVRYISEHYISDRISIPYLASLCGISESYLKRIFVSRYHMPPKRYILHLKMEYAVEMLASGMFSVSRVAEMLGYENVYYFGQAFKNYMGISPSGYMKNCKSSK